MNVTRFDAAREYVAPNLLAMPFAPPGSDAAIAAADGGNTTSPATHPATGLGLIAPCRRHRTTTTRTPETP